MTEKSTKRIVAEIALKMLCVTIWAAVGIQILYLQ